MTYVFNQTTINVLFLPLTMIMTWLVFKRRNPSFKLTSWYAMYSAAHVNLLMVPSILFFWLPNKNVFNALNGLSTIGLLGYQVWVVMKFFKVEFGKAFWLFLLLRILLTLLFLFELGLVIFLIYTFA